MSLARRCSRTPCSRRAVSTLTYVYADQTAVLGPLSTYAEPHAYDLCEVHGERLSVPRGWEVLRLPPDPAALEPSDDDLLALADAVREAGRTVPLSAHGDDVGHGGPADGGDGGSRRSHLRVLT